MQLKKLKPALRLLALIVIIGFIFSTEACHNRLFLFPDNTVRHEPKLLYENVSFVNANGKKLAGWYFPVENPLGAVVLNHGNSGNIGLYLDYAEFLTSAGVSLLLYDYQGFGNSEGSASLSSVVDDALAAFDYLESRPDAPDSIAVMGVSLGTPVSCRVMAKRPQARTLILEGAFLPKQLIYQRMTLLGRPLAWVVTKSIYLTDPLEDVRHLEGRPLLMVHGTDDGTTPLDGAQTLFDYIKSEKLTQNAEFWRVEGVKHFPEISFHRKDEYQQVLTKFMHEVFGKDKNLTAEDAEERRGNAEMKSDLSDKSDSD